MSNTEIEKEKYKNKLFLGDEIKLNANVPDSKLQNNVYEIVYVDSALLKLNNKQTRQIINVKIHNDKMQKIEDEEVTEIQIIKRKASHKYVEQSDFKIDMTLSIELSPLSPQSSVDDDESLFILCKIVDVDKNQDTIEVKLLLDDLGGEVKDIAQDFQESIFINFGCSGLPPWIKTIKVIEFKPKAATMTMSTGEEHNMGLGLGEEEEEQDSGIDIDLADALDEGNKIFASIMYEVPSSQKIVSETKQYDDLLENIISSVPKSRRTDAELNGIHRGIERFFQLRKEYSLFDKNGVPKMPKALSEHDKPSVIHIQNLDTNLQWVLPVVENIKKLYVTEDDAIGVNTVNAIYDFKDTILEQKNVYPDKNSRHNPKLMEDMNSYLTPFENPKQNPDNKYVVQNKPVSTNILTLSTNNDTIVSSKGSSGPKAQTHIDRAYNLGLTKLEFEDVKSNNVKRVDSTPSDPAYITSFITLNKQAVALTQMGLPDTLLADRVLMDSMYLKTWSNIMTDIKFKDDVVTEVINVDRVVEGREEEEERLKEYKGGIVFSDVMAFTPNESISNSTHKIGQFINSFVPTNEDAFSAIESRLGRCLSMHEVVYALQPFLIYNKDLTEHQYDTMRAFINKNIVDYMKRLSSSSVKFKKLVDKNAITKLDSLELFYDAFNEDEGKRVPISKELHKKIVLANDETTSLDEIFKLYKLTDDKNGGSSGGDGFLSSSEILKMFLDVDFARLFMDVMAVENSDLTSSEMDSILKREQQDLKEKMMKDSSGADSKTCKKREINLSRVYLSPGELELDSGKPGDILFDSKYDSSGKRIVKDGDYAALKIVDHDDGSVRYDYYVRRNSEWTIDKDPELQNVQVDDPSYFCNIPSETKPKPLCFSINQKCLDKSMSESSLLNDLTSKIISEFDSRSEVKKRNIDDIFLRDFKNIKLLFKLKFFEILKYNQNKYLLGQEHKKNVTTVVRSPYREIVDCILGMDDIGKKYQCILDLVNSELFVRDALPDEDARWYYCKSCGVPGVCLLPTFFYELAHSYNPQDPKSSKYITTLSQIERKNGKREGDQFVDKYSGYSISKIALVSEGWLVEEEGGGEGVGGGGGGFSESAVNLIRSEEENASDLAAVNSGEIIDASIKSERVEEKGQDDGEGKGEEDEEEEEEEEEEEYEKEEGEDEEEEEGSQVENETVMSLNSIINHYETSLSVVFKNKDKRFIVETIQLLLPKKKTKEQYELDKKTTVEYEAYEKTYNQYLIFYSMALIIIVIQSSIPQIKSKTTFPNCVKSFSGYPFSLDEGNLSFVIYMACISQKVKSDYAPWNSIKKINQDKMRDTLFSLIKTKILNQPQIQSRFDKKREFDALKEQKKSSHSKSGMKINVASSHFRPLLVDPSAFITSTPLPVTKTYCDDLKRNLKNGSNLQTEKILVLQSKVIHFSLIVQKLIQEVISSQTKDRSKLLSKNYIQNACCNERDSGSGEDFHDKSVTTLDYMVNHVPNIKNYCDMVECTSAILHDIYSLSEASIMLDPRDTRNNVPDLPTNFDEFTIYNAFMTYCNYGNAKGGAGGGVGATSLSSDIHKICKFKNTLGENRDIFNILKNSQNMDMSPADKMKLIDKIKNEFNLEYTTKDLQHLLQLVNGQTMKPMNEYQAGVGTYNENLNRILLKAIDDFKMKSKAKESKMSVTMLFPEDFIVALKKFNENRTQTLMRELQIIIEKNITSLNEKCEKYLNFNTSSKNVTFRNAIFRTAEDIEKGIFKNGGIMLFNKMENTLLNGENNSLEVSMEFVRNAIKNMTQVYPNIILSQVSAMESLPPYISGQLSSGDSESIIKFSNERITNKLNNFYKIGNKKPIDTILKNAQTSTLFLNEVVKNTPVFSDAKHMTVLLYEYYFLLAVDSYIHFSEIAKQKQLSQVKTKSGKSVVDIQKEISRILETYFNLIVEDKKLVNKDIENIRENYLRAIDEERDDIVQNVEKMSEDQKQIYLNHKKYKMGTQSIGKNTGLRIYNPDFETEELARIERINGRKKARGLPPVTDDPEALAREDAVEDEGDAPDMDADDVMNETQEDDGQEEYAASADMYPDSYQDEGAEEMREEE
jgi:hypothetical protein